MLRTIFGAVFFGQGFHTKNFVLKQGCKAKKSRVNKKMTTQLSIDFNPDIYGQYESCREFIAEDDIPRLCRSPRILKKTIAADMDYSPSHFTNKLANVEGHRFTLDDLERYMNVTGSIEPVKYLVGKYLFRQSPKELKSQIEELQRKLQELEGECR